MKKPLSNLCSYSFWCSSACKQWEMMPGMRIGASFLFHFVQEKKKGRQISAQASPDPEYDSLIFTKMRATHLSKTSRGGQTWSSSRMDRERRQVGPWAEVQVHYNS